MKLIFFLLLNFLSQNLYSQKRNVIPANFVEFEKSPSNGDKFKFIEIDFDNDKKIDYISVIHNKIYNDIKTNKKYLLIHLSTLNKNVLIDFDNFNGVYFIQPKIKNRTLEFQIYQEGTGVYGHNLKLRYNKEYKKIELIGYDFSYRTPGGHCNKSYNLLTGKFKVINDFYDFRTKSTKFEKFDGIAKRKNKIFVSDFSSELFGKLSQVGKEFERD